MATHTVSRSAKKTATPRSHKRKEPAIAKRKSVARGARTMKAGAASGDSPQPVPAKRARAAKGALGRETATAAA